jgi:hypothetical protein
MRKPAAPLAPPAFGPASENRSLVLARLDWLALLLVLDQIGLLELLVATLVKRVLTLHVSLHLLRVGDLRVADFASHFFALRNED